MPLGFKGNILTTSSSAVVANTQVASWDIVTNAGGFSPTSTAAFNTALMTDYDGSADNCDSTITLYPSDSNFRFNSNYDYTVEFWLGFTNTNTVPQSHDIFEIALAGEGLDGTTNNYGRITANGSNTFFYTRNQDTTYARSNFQGGPLHCAIVGDASNDTQSWYINGSRQVNDTAYTYNGNARALAFGFKGTRNANGPRAIFDEIRVSNTIRYTGSSYTVPTSAFTPDANTIALFHCDGNMDDSSRG
jgi:hypothetical protein